MVVDMVVLMENSGTVRMPTSAQMRQEMVMVTIMLARTLMPTMALMDLFSATQAHGLAGLGQLHKAGERDDDDDGHGHDVEIHAREHHIADAHHAGEVAGEGQREVAPEEVAGLGNDRADHQRGDDGVQARHILEGDEHQRRQQQADDRHYGQRPGRAQEIGRAQAEHERAAEDVGAQHDQLRVGKVQQLTGIPDQGVLNGDQAVDESHRRSGGQQLQDHVFTSPFQRAPALRPDR